MAQSQLTRTRENIVGITENIIELAQSQLTRNMKWGDIYHIRSHIWPNVIDTVTALKQTNM